jgi:hypothetical protein
MRKIVLFLHTGYCGMDSHEFWEVSETATDDELNDLCWERAVDHAGSYGVYPRDEYADEPEFEDGDQYSDNIEGSFQDYDPEEHDGHRVGGDTSWSTY